MRDRKGIVNAHFPTVRLQRYQSPEGWMGPIRITQSIANGTTVFWLVTQIILVPVERQLGGTFFVWKSYEKTDWPHHSCMFMSLVSISRGVPTKAWLFLFKYHMMKIRHSERTQSKQWIMKIWQVQHRPLPRSCDTQLCSQIYSMWHFSQDGSMPLLHLLYPYILINQVCVLCYPIPEMGTLGQ